MTKQFLKDGLGWGFFLWFIGYVLGIVFFIFLPPHLIGWAIVPIGTAITLWVLFKKISSVDTSYYFKLGVLWTLIAIALDYLFVVQLLNPEDGYYKPAVYLYYILTLALPVLVGRYKFARK